MGELDEHTARARAAREALVGRTIASGRYVLRGLVGHGGMGAVYEAEHVGLGKRVAVKFVDPEFATDERVVARFAREARAMSAIESAHIVSVFDAGTEDGRPYLVMELLRGEDLGQRLRRTTRTPRGEAMHVVAQVLKGLARAHAAGIVHRDLKPDNVFLVRSDTDPLFAKIVDFGISKIERPRASTTPLALTGRGTVLGTPFYMSPEQAQAVPDVDARTDLYSVGAILFECLSGRPPHTGESYEQVILSICMRDAPDLRAIDPKIPDDVAAFVARALSREREQRFSSAERMLAALHEIAPDEKARVPLDPAAPATLLSAGTPVSPSASADPGAASPISAETRLVGALPLGAPSSEPAGKVSERSVPVRPQVISDASMAPLRDLEPPAAPASASLASTGQGEGLPRTRSLGPVIATALVATLLGVGATFAIITALDKKPDGGPAPKAARTTAAPRESAEPATITSAVATPGGSSSSTVLSPLDPPAPSSNASAPTAAPSARPTAAAPTPASSTAAPAPKGSGGAAPKGSSKPLDIQRDLP